MEEIYVLTYFLRLAYIYPIALIYCYNVVQTNLKHSKTHDSNAKQELNKLADASQTELMRCTSIFPFTFFPDTIHVAKTKIDIVYGVFFFSRRVFSILYEDIKTLRISTNLLFASFQFEIVGYEQNPEPVRFLPKRKAMRTRQLIMGMVSIKREGVEIGTIKKDELISKALAIGRAV